MFVAATRRRNPALLEASVELHRRGDVPSNSYVIDIDTVSANAAHVAAAGREHGLTLYQMTKQFGRNPLVAQAVRSAGIDRVVAVDFEEARLLHRYGLPIGHLGHLVQIPRHEVELAVEMVPEFITVFGLDQARRVSEAAEAAGRVQPILIRVIREGDTFYPAQKGGILIDDLVTSARTLNALGGISIAGCTSFPCLLWNETTGQLEPTQNLQTVAEGVHLLRAAGIDATVLNTPSASCPASFPTLAAAGATHVEPGSCLTGHTPLHAASDQAELPAMVYVSEITHQTREATYSLGGGFYPRSKAREALIYPQGLEEPVVARVELDPAEAIDYYGTLHLDDPGQVSVGDTVVYAFRSQVFVSRCFVAVVGGVGSREPEVLGVFDRAGYRLGPDLLPVPTVA